MEESDYSKSNLYVKHIPPDLDEREMESLFQKFGQVGSVKILRDSVTRRGRGIGFVRFIDVNGAQAAMNELNGGMAFPRQVQPLLIEYAESDNLRMRKKAARMGMNPTTQGQLNLEPQTSEMPPPSFQFTQYSYHPLACSENTFSELSRALETILSPSDIMAYRRYVLDMAANERLPPSIYESELHHLFEKFGELLSVNVVKKEDGSSKGYGFVTFRLIEDAERALEEMDGSWIEGKTIRVSWKRKE